MKFIHADAILRILEEQVLLLITLQVLKSKNCCDSVLAFLLFRYVQFRFLLWIIKIVCSIQI